MQQDDRADENSEKINAEAIEKELDKEKPRKEVLLPLMKSTFPARRSYILHEAGSVNDTVQKYPALKMHFIVRVVCI